MSVNTHSLVTANIAELVGTLPTEPQGVRSSRLFKGPGVSLVGVTMDAGAAMKEHIAAVPIMLQIIDGRVVIGVSGERIDLVSGAIFHINANARHSVDALEPSHVLIHLLGSVPARGARPAVARERNAAKAPSTPPSPGGAAQMVLATSGADAAAIASITRIHAELSGTAARMSSRVLGPAASDTGPQRSVSEMLDWCRGPLSDHLDAEESAFDAILRSVDTALPERLKDERARIDEAIERLAAATESEQQAEATVDVRTRFAHHLRTMDEFVLPLIAGTSTLSLAGAWRHAAHSAREGGLPSVLADQLVM